MILDFWIGSSHSKHLKMAQGGHMPIFSWQFRIHRVKWEDKDVTNKSPVSKGEVFNSFKQIMSCGHRLWWYFLQQLRHLTLCASGWELCWWKFGIRRVDMPKRPSTCQKGCPRRHAKQDCLRRHAKDVPVDMPKKIVSVDMPKECPSMCQNDGVRQHAKNLCPSTGQNSVL